MPIKFKGQETQERNLEALRVKEQEDAAQKTAESFHLPYVDLALKPIHEKTLELIPEYEARKARIAVISQKGDEITIALEDPENPYAKETIKDLEKRFADISLVVVSSHSMEKAWAGYEKRAPHEKIVGEVQVSTEALQNFQQKIKTFSDLPEALREIILKKNTSEILELLLASALRLDASDIHIEPGNTRITLRLRIDGLLHDVGALDLHAYKLLLSRIKLLSAMKLNIHAIAQDGRFSVRVESLDLQIRTATLPGEYGENIVMRVLNPLSLLSVGELGIRPDILAMIEKHIMSPNGMILTTGPTGSGKTTTLYAFLRRLQTPEIKIITVEDPIEYHLEGISQTQVVPERGYTFLTGLRAIVRQDPDVILVGEIRDLETADVALQASLTGHLVLSTLHANDTAGVVPRLADIGANLTTVGPALLIAIAQRLVRKICEACKTLRKVTDEELAILSHVLSSLPETLVAKNALKSSLQVPEAQGCPTCNNSGYKGRIGIYEILVNNPEFQKLILANPSISEIREFTKSKGMTTLKQDGFLKVIQGITTIEEVERITGE
ncbi:MAG: type II/IV secretion system protein [Candidatus Spechtbacteria bacterium]|nr:type II/IV secretion system protein [Candidatus Spechtbacteria bacterium]